MLPGMTVLGGPGGAGGGGGGAEVSMIDRNAYNSAVTPTNVTTTWELTSAGADNSDNDTPATRTWLLSGVGADYQLFVSVTSGTLSTGTVGSWVSLGSNQTYTKTRTSDAAADETVFLSCQVRRASDSVILATFTVDITVEVLP